MDRTDSSGPNMQHWKMLDDTRDMCCNKETVKLMCHCEVIFHMFTFAKKILNVCLNDYKYSISISMVHSFHSTHFPNMSYAVSPVTLPAY